jgi:L,D-transpeptidase ErfK/SrfK
MVVILQRLFEARLFNSCRRARSRKPTRACSPATRFRRALLLGGNACDADPSHGTSRYNAAMKTTPDYLRMIAITALPMWASLNAATFELPAAGDAVIGDLQKYTARYEDTLIDIARLHSLGFNEIRHANPKVDTWLPGEGTEVVLPKRFLLPDAPREGIVINVAEMRLYYYPKAGAGEQPQVITYPMSIGRNDWQTPLGATEITAKVKDPVWYPPESVRKEHAAEGDVLPKVVPPGPDNPLGKYALRLGLASYLIHGTNKPFGIGMQVTHGCMRLYPEDIGALYNAVPVGTPVRIVNQPYKAGWYRDELYLEVHVRLSGEIDGAVPQNLTPVVEQLVAATQGRAGYIVDWDKVQRIVDEHSGIPFTVGQEDQKIAAADEQGPQTTAPGSNQAR